MLERKASKNKNQIYELTPELIGRTVERVPRQLRKGVPEEYSQLLNKARTDTNVMVGEQLNRAAKLYVPKLYDILVKDNGYTPKNARIVIVADCTSIWSKVYVETYLPTETKDQRKVKGANEQVRKRREKIDKTNNDIKDTLKPIIPDPTQDELKALRKFPRLIGLAAADQETRERVARAGGIAKLEQHPEEFSEMGKESADKWNKLKEEAKTFNLEIEDEEHRQFVNAYQQSLVKRANGTGGYVLFIKNGEYDRVEASNGAPEKSVNK